MVTFIHTSDLQIGMPFKSLSEKANHLMKVDRIEVISTIGSLAKAEAAEFIIVCGDLFDSSLLDAPTIVQTCKKISEIPLNVYVLAGNHEWKDSNTNILESELFLANRPKNLIVLHQGINSVSPDVEIYAVPLTGTYNQQDVLDSINQIPKFSGRLRILVMHGQIDSVTPLTTDLIKAESVKKLIDEGRVHYVALGDRHSTRNCESSDELPDLMTGRVYYSGAPEPTDFDEINQGYVLKIELDLDRISVVARKVGKWTFKSIGTRKDRIVIDSETDFEKLLDNWKSMADPKTVMKIYCDKYLHIPKLIEFEAKLAELNEHYFAKIHESDSNPENRVPIEVDDSNPNPLELSGFMLDTYLEIQERASKGDETAVAALKLLFRLGQTK